jgi:excisionase family DNA binding protein
MLDSKPKRKVLTVPEFSEQTGVPQSTVRRWLKKKELKGTRIGRKWLIPFSELDRITDPSPS